MLEHSGGVQQVRPLQAASTASARIKVVPTNRGNHYSDVLAAYESAASGHKSQLPGIVYLEDNTVLEMANSGNVLPAQSCMEADHYDSSDIEPAVSAEYTLHKILWPGYMNVSTPVLYYNKADFVRAGLDPNRPPGTLAEIMADAKKLKSTGVNPTPFAFRRDVYFLTQWVDGDGGSVLSGSDGRALPAGQVAKATFDGPQATAAMTWLKQMKDQGLMVSFDYTGGPTGIDQYLSLLPDGKGNSKAAMLLETSTAATTIRSVLAGKITGQDAGINFNASVVKKSAIVPGTGPFPGISQPGKVQAGGGAFYILNAGSSAEQAASWEFLKYMLQPQNVLKWVTVGGYLPTTQVGADAAGDQVVLHQRPGRRVAQARHPAAGRRRPEAARAADRAIPGLRDRRADTRMDKVLLNGAELSDSAAGHGPSRLRGRALQALRQLTAPADGRDRGRPAGSGRATIGAAPAAAPVAFGAMPSWLCRSARR